MDTLSDVVHETTTEKKRKQTLAGAHWGLERARSRYFELFWLRTKLLLN